MLNTLEPSSRLLPPINPDREVARIDGNVDPSTGNIDVPGDLRVGGNVADFFQIRCAGDALIDGVIEAAEVNVHGDLWASGGISGKGKGLCRVGGNIRSRYITNATVHSEGNITAETQISSSRIVCAGDLKIENGPLVGGHATVIGSLSCLSAGAPSGTATLIEVGVDESLRTLAAASLPQIERCQREAAHVRATLAPLLKIQKSLSSQQKETVTEMLFDADGLDAQAIELLDALRERRNVWLSRPDAEIHIANTLNAGVTIRFPRIQATFDAALKGPLRVVLRTSGGQRYISLIEDSHQAGYPISSRPWEDPVMDNLARVIGNGLQAKGIEMDVAYINPFIAGTREVFDAMVKMPFSVGKPRVRDCQERLHKLYTISVVIGLSGAVSGVLVMNLAEGVALALVAALAGVQPKSLDADSLDALAEIANMIAGAAKKRLPAGQITITIPTLVRTADVVYPAGLPILVLPFDAPCGRFLIEIAMRPK